MLKIGHICDQLPATWSHAGHKKFFGNNLDHKRSPREGFKAVCPKTTKSNRHATDSSHSARVCANAGAGGGRRRASYALHTVGLVSCSPRRLCPASVDAVLHRVSHQLSSETIFCFRFGYSAIAATLCPFCHIPPAQAVPGCLSNIAAISKQNLGLGSDGQPCIRSCNKLKAGRCGEVEHFWQLEQRDKGCSLTRAKSTFFHACEGHPEMQRCFVTLPEI